jgi:hypothetical protein
MCYEEETVMKKWLLLVSSAILMVVWCYSFCFAGAWTQNRGAMYNRLVFNYYYADERFDGGGQRKDFDNNGDFKDLNVNYYVEYGLTCRLTAIGSFYYKYLEYDDETVKLETYDFGDIDFALKYRLYNGPLGVFSVQGLVKIPGVYDRHERLAIGNGQYDLEFRVLYGLSLWRFLPGYCNFEVGYRWRADDPSDEFRYLAEFGMYFVKNTYGRIKLDGILGLRNAEKDIDFSGNPAATLDFDLGKLDAALGYKISPRWAVELGYVPEIYGLNTSAGARYSMAVVYQFH